MPVPSTRKAPASSPIKPLVSVANPRPCYSLPLTASRGTAASNCLHDASRPLDVTVLGVSIDSTLTTITCALCRFRQLTTSSRLLVELCSYGLLSLDPAIVQRVDLHIRAESSQSQHLPEADARLFGALSGAQLDHLYVDAVEKFCDERSLDMSAVNAISLQGQPLGRDCNPNDRALRAAVASAEASALAKHTGTTCVFNLPSSEPFTISSASLNAMLLRHPSRTRLCQHIGRTHTSYCLVPAGNTVGRLDTVTEAIAEPGTSFIDDVVRHYTDNKHQLDRDGEMAAAGTVNPKLAQLFLQADKQSQTSSCNPDSSVAVPALQAQDLIACATAAHLKPNDAVATATHIVAQSMLAALSSHSPAPCIDDVLVCGGGARNPTLIRALASAYPYATIAPLESIGLPSKARDAAATAWRGVEALLGRVPRAHIIPGRGYRTLTRGVMAFGGPAEDLPPVREAVKVVNDAPVLPVR